MAFIPKQGEFKKTPMAVTPSTAFAANSLVTITSGKLVPATAATASADIVGIIPKAIVSTDSDYAVDRLVDISVPQERYVVLECDVTSGLVAADVGIEVNLTDASTINRAAVTVKVARCKQVISTTKGLFYVKFFGAY